MTFRASTFAFIALGILAVAGASQSRTNTIQRPCSGTTITARVQVESDGDINLAPCSGRTITTSGSTTLYDSSFTGSFLTPNTSRFRVGSTANQVISSANNFLAVDLYAKPDLSATTSKFAVGLSNFMTPVGTGTSANIVGLYNTVTEGGGFSGSYSSMYSGIFTMFANTGNLTGNMQGLNITSGPSGFSFTTALTSNNYGISSAIRHGYNATFNDVIAVQGRTAGVNATVATTTRLIGVLAQHTGSGGTAANNVVTNRYGVYVGDYATTNYLVTNNYGIYLDATVDELGSGSKYALYSLATSPSFFTGKVTFDTMDTAGGTTGNQTINKPSFSINFAAGTSSLVVTNSFISATSYVLCTVQTNDATALLKNATPAAGSVTIRLNANATAETRVACLVTN